MLRGKVITKRTIEYSIRVFSQKRLPNPEIPFLRIMKNPALKKIYMNELNKWLCLSRYRMEKEYICFESDGRRMELFGRERMAGKFDLWGL